MKAGPKDIKVFLLFEQAELKILQDNTWQMAEAFGLDMRIARLTGKRKVGFYRWDLDCLEAVIDSVKTDTTTDKDPDNNLHGKLCCLLPTLSATGQYV